MALFGKRNLRFHGFMVDNDDDVVSGEDDDVEKCKFVSPSPAHPPASQ